MKSKIQLSSIAFVGAELKDKIYISLSWRLNVLLTLNDESQI
jgi:hypothetical protein